MMIKDLTEITAYLSHVEAPITLSMPKAPDHALAFCNPAFTDLTGYSGEEVVGRNCRFLQGDARDQPGAALISKCLATGREVAAPLLNFKKSGEAFVNLIFINAILTPDGERAATIGCQFEISAGGRFGTIAQYLDYMNDYFSSGPLCPDGLKFLVESKFRVTEATIADAKHIAALGAFSDVSPVFEQAPATLN